MNIKFLNNQVIGGFPSALFRITLDLQANQTQVDCVCVPAQLFPWVHYQQRIDMYRKGIIIHDPSSESPQMSLLCFLSRLARCACGLERNAWLPRKKKLKSRFYFSLLFPS